MIKSTRAQPIPNITSKQKEILFLLYKFRFLSTNHFVKLFNHKDPHRVKEWLSDLREKDCIRRNYERKSFGDNAKPAIYYLAPKARLILKREKELDFSELEYIYKESHRTKKFIDHSLFLVDVYLYLLSVKDIDEEIKFFTKAELHQYEYFPDPIPDAFIAVTTGSSTRRYFLDLFDDFTPPFAMRRRVRNYLEYAEKPDWDENTNDTPFPSILVICPNESAKRHIYKYAMALLEKTFEAKLKLFLTTKIRVEVGEKDNIWQRI